MATQAEFIRQQYAFAAHIRDPQHAPAPAEVEDRRMGIYRELFYNNVEGFISNTFPVLREIHDDDAWHGMVREYFRNHHARTPLFLEIPREFLTWLHDERTAQADDLPFLYELAHYEWAELALTIAEDSTDSNSIDPDGDLLAGIPRLSPLVWHMTYAYPVHKIGPDFIPDAPSDSPVSLVVYRDCHDEVGFMEINPVTKRLLEIIEPNKTATGRELLARIAAEMAHPDPEVVINGGLEIMLNLKQKDIITGTNKQQVPQ
ncbi:MAG: putative DNA-binding domain-containing protein [Gammaproteobacteria bacterium]|nr:putative DNA-binding domain-containing protein [Gammaproteobacteria bacterium]